MAKKKTTNGNSRQVVPAPAPASTPADPAIEDDSIPLRFRWKEAEQEDDEVIACVEDLYDELVPPGRGTSSIPTS